MTGYHTARSLLLLLQLTRRDKRCEKRQKNTVREPCKLINHKAKHAIALYTVLDICASGGKAQGCEHSMMRHIGLPATSHVISRG